MPGTLPWALMLGGCLLTLSQVSGESIRIDFEDGFVPIRTIPNKPSHVTGEVCPPFEENSAGWAEVDMTFSRLTEEAFEGTTAMRVEVSAIREGRAQIRIPQVASRPGAYGQLSLALRAPQSAAVGLGIRTVGPPWKHVWQKQLSVSPEWQKFEFIIPPLPAADGYQYCFLVYLQAGVLDIDDFSLAFVPKSELADSGAVRQGNLLPNSSFPGGLPSPWSVSSAYLKSAAATDASTPGPTGQPALKLTTGMSNSMMPRRRGVELVSPPLALNSFRQHTVSFWAKGVKEKQVVRVSLGDPAHHRMTGQAEVGLQWQRCTVTGEVPLLVEGFALLTVSTDDVLWLDGLRLEEAGSAGEFRRSAGVELGLVHTRPYGLHEEGEPLKFKVVTVGNVTPNLSLQGTIADMRGHATPFTGVPLNPEAKAGQAVVVKGAGEQPFGTYRVEARVVDAQGRAVSPWAEIVLHRIRRARFSDQDAPRSPFGIHVNPIASEAAMVKRLGFNWIRVHDASVELTKWYFLENAPEEFDWSAADAGVELYRNHKLMILGMLDTCPVWRTDAPESDRSWHSKYYLPNQANLEAWENYCRTVVARYRGRIDHWEVWNEPYVKSFFRLRQEKGKLISGTPADYVSLLALAFRACRAANPDATVLWASQPSEWGDGCVELGAPQFADEMSFHAYISPSPLSFPDFDKRLVRLRQDLSPVEKTAAVWNTEGGCGGANMQHWLAHASLDDSGRDYAVRVANHLVRYEIASLVAGVERFFLYTFHKWYWRSDWNLRLPDGGLAPNATALSNLMWHLEGKAYRRTQPLASGYRAHLFAGEDEWTAAILKTQPLPGSWALPSLPADFAARDLYGNPVTVDDVLDDGVWYVTAPAARGKLLEALLRGE